MKRELAPSTVRLARRMPLSQFLAPAGVAIRSAAATVASIWSAAAETASTAWFAAQSNDFRLEE